MNGAIQSWPSNAGIAFNASNHGGPTIPRVSLQLIFWGSKWPNPPSGPSADQITGATESMLRGPYMSGLLQYGIYLGTFRGKTIYNSEPPNPFSTDDWHNKIQELIDNGVFPEPDEPGGFNLYMFVLPVGTKCATGAPGAHGHPWNTVIDVDMIYAGYVTNDGNLDSVMTYLSHEVVEACSDPEAQHDDAWTIDGLQHPNSEICDVCSNSSGPVNGISVQAYWSNFDQACIVPDFFSLWRFMKMKGLDPSKGLLVLNPPVESVLTFILAG